EQVMATAVNPTLHELVARGIDYRGVLYVGLMLTADGPKLVEYNVRFGDPESQVVLPLLRSDLCGLLHAAAVGDSRLDVRFEEDACVTVVLATEGYPVSPRSGDPIDGLDDAAAVHGVTVFHAGTKRDGSRIVTAGGRVLAVTAVAPSIG